MKKNRLICMVVLLRLLLLGAAAGVAYYVLSDKDYVSYSHGDDEDDDDPNRLYTRKIIKEVEGKRCVFYLYSYNRYSSYDDPDLADYCSEDYYSIDNLQIMWPQSFEGHDISGLQKELLNAISNLNWPGAQGKGAREDYNSIDSLYMGWVTALNENEPLDTISKIPDDAEPYRIFTDSTRVSVVWHNDRVISYELFQDVYIGNADFMGSISYFSYDLVHNKVITPANAFSRSPLNLVERRVNEEGMWDWFFLNNASDYFDGPRMPEIIYLEKKAINFVYPMNELGMRPATIKVPVRELKDYLSPELLEIYGIKSSE